MALSGTVSHDALRLRKLLLKNHFQEDLACSPDAGSQVIVIGDTSSGKSTTINFILGFPFSFSSKGVATRRPCIISLVPVHSMNQIIFKCRFQAKTISTTDMKQVACFVQDVNDFRLHPEWFDGPSGFDRDPVYVEMHGDFDFALRVVDLPGLTRDTDEPLAIANDYLKHVDHLPLLVVGTEDVANGGFGGLAERMRHCQSPTVIQNFASEQCRKGDAKRNYDEIVKRLGHTRLTFFCVDFGLPYGSLHWVQGQDQDDYLNESGGDTKRVQAKMRDHESSRAQQLKDKFQRDEPNFLFGLTEVREKLQLQATSDLDSVISKLRSGVQKEQKRLEAEIERFELELRRLQNPPEWANFLAKIALFMRLCFDGTLSLDGSGETTEQELDNLRTAVEEVITSSTSRQGVSAAGVSNGLLQHGTARPATSEAESESPDLVTQAVSWFDAETDHVIRSELAHVGFSHAARLRGLPSWYRLLDEFAGMLAFSPMPAIRKSVVSQIWGGIGDGVSATSNFLDKLCESVILQQSLICTSAGSKRTYFISSLLETFVRRLELLVNRDIEAAMVRFRKDARAKCSEVRRFLALLGVDGDDSVREDLLNKVEDVLRKHIAGTVRTAVDELCHISSDGDAASKHGAPSWVTPLKAHRMNAQLDASCIRFHNGHERRSVVDRPLRLFFSGTNLWFFFEVLQRRPPGGPGLQSLLALWHLTQSLLEIRRLTYADPLRGRRQSAQRPIAVASRRRGGSDSTEVIMPGRLTVNASNWFNREIFRRMTHAPEFRVQAPLEVQVYDEETFRLVYAIQRELADTFTGAYKGLIQQMKSTDAVRRNADFVGEHDVRGIMHWFADPDSSSIETEAWDFCDEVDKCLLLWPMYDTKDMYVKAVKAAARGANLVPRDRFLSQLPDKLFGPPSWLRLCHEFLYVLTHLRMPRVDTDEVENCRCSSSASKLAPCEDVVSKLAMHRLEEAGTKNRDVFVERMLQLVRRDAHHAAKEAERQGHLQTALRKAAEQSVIIHAEHVIRESMRLLERRLVELQPFDRTILNGRTEIARAALREDGYEHATGTRHATGARPPTDAFASSQHLRTGSASGRPFVELCSAVSFYSAFTQESDLRVQAVLNRPQTNPPCGDEQLAGGEFHEIALKVHKSICVDSIGHCRPRLSKVIACAVNEESLRNTLHMDPTLDYRRLYGPLIDKKARQLDRSQQRLLQLMEHLTEYDTIYFGASAVSNAAATETIPTCNVLDDTTRPEDSASVVDGPADHLLAVGKPSGVVSEAITDVDHLTARERGILM